MTRRRLLATAFAFGLALVVPMLAAAQETPPAPPPSPVTVEAIEVTPSDPGVDTLVKLRVRLRNGGDAAVSALHFRVVVGGVDLPVYDNQTFLSEVPAGGEIDLELYNFWTTETGRPAPADGKLAVEVTLDEAYRVAVTTEEDGTEVWTLGEPVAVSSTRRIVLELKQQPAGG